MKYNYSLKFLNSLGLIIISIFLSSCSSTIPSALPVASTAKKNPPTVTVAKQLIPAGWADITVRSERPEIKYWLINRTNSATMVLREFQIDSLSQQSLMNEDVNVMAKISLFSKLPENNSDYRITRVPAVIDAKRNFISYVYSEKGLLRRVVMFKKQQKYFELELIQEHSSEEFDDLTDELLTFAATLFDR